jgi:hypothetical protein
MVFYNQYGQPVAYTEDGIHIFLFTGEPAAYFSQDAIYGFNGKQLGWFHNGWIRDLNGQCVFFSENASGGPAKPAKYACPAKYARYAMPAKAARQARFARAAFSPSWSALSGVQFFAQ